jgi:FkbM family methyltransferase
MNLALNNLRNVVVCDFALGSSAGHARPYGSTASKQGTASLKPDTITNESFDVKLDTIDHYIGSISLPRVDVIKVDAEGADFSILTGAAETLTRYKPCIYIEVSTECLSRFGATPRDIYDLLRELGYEMWKDDTARAKEIRLVPLISPHVKTSAEVENWLAVHPGSVCSDGAR